MANELRIQLTVEGARIARGEVDHVAGSFGSVARSAQEVGRNAEIATQSISRMGQALTAAFSVRELVQASDAWSSLNAQLKISTGSALAGAEAYATVARIALDSGQALGEIGNVYKRFADNATTLGLSQQQVAAATRTVAQAMALSGGSAASSQAALMQFGQALASGTLRGEELNSVLEQAPRLAKTLADGLGVPIGKLRQLAEQGQITSEAIIKALSGQAGKVADEFGQLPLTVGRAMENLRTAFTDTVGSFEKSSGVFRAAAGGLDLLANNMNTVAEAGAVLASVMAGRVVASIAASTAAKVADIQASLAKAQADNLAAGAAARAAQAEQQAALIAQTRARDRVAATQAEVAAHRERVASTVLAAEQEIAARQAQFAATAVIVRAEIELEKARFAAQINDTGRAQRVAAMGALSAELAAIEKANAALSGQLAATRIANERAIGEAAAAGAAKIVAAREAEIVATEAAAAATLNYRATTAAAGAATAAASTAAGAARTVLGALGGPIGLVTTALTLGATAWMLWGSKADESTREVARSAAERIDSLIAKIAEMNGRLADTTRKSYDAQVAAGASELKTVRAEIGDREARLAALETAGGRGRFSEQGKQLQAELNGLAEREITLQKELGEAREKSAIVGTAAVNQFIDANAVGADKVRVKQTKLLEDFKQAIANTGGVLDLQNEAHLRAYNALNAGLADAAKSTEQSGKKAESTYQSLMKSIREKTAAEEAGIGTTDKATAGEKLALKTMVDLRDGALKLTDAQKIALAAELERYLVLEKLNIAEQDAVKNAVVRADGLAKMNADELKHVNTLTASNEKLRDEIANLGASGTQQAAYQAEKLRTAAATDNLTASQLEERAGLLETQKVMPEVAAGYRELAAAKRAAAGKLITQADLTTERAAKETAVKAAADSTKAWEKFADDIERSLTDSLYRSFEAGKGFGETFVSSLKATLKAAALKLVIQYAVTGSGDLFASAANAVLGTSFSTNSRSGTALGGYLSGASNLNTAYGLYNGSYLNTATGLWNNYAAGTSIGGYTLGYIGAGGTGVSGSVGAGVYGSAYGSGGLGLSATGGATGVTGSVAGYGSATAGTAGTAGGSAGASGASASGMSAASVAWVAAIVAGMYMSSEAWKAGYVADGKQASVKDPTSWSQSIWDVMYLEQKTILGESFAKSQLAAILTGSSLSMMVHSAVMGALFGKTRVTGTAVGGTFSDAAGFDGTSSTSYKKSGGLFSSSREWTDSSPLPADVDAVFTSLYTSIKAGLVGVGTAFEDSTLAAKLVGFSKTVTASGSSTIAQMVESWGDTLTESMGQVMLPSIDALRIAASADGTVPAEKWSAALLRIVQETNVVASMLGMTGKTLIGVFGKDHADAILEASDNLTHLFGGIDQLNSEFGAYYTAFYSPAKRLGQAWKDMSYQFATMGRAVPTTISGFRGLVDSLDLTSESGQTTFAALIKLAPAFSDLIDATRALAQETAVNLIDAFTAKGALVPVLAGISDNTQALTANLSGTRAQALALATGFTEAQIRAGALGSTVSGGLVSSLSAAQVKAVALASGFIEAQIRAGALGGTVAGGLVSSLTDAQVQAAALATGFTAAQIKAGVLGSTINSLGSSAGSVSSIFLDANSQTLNFGGALDGLNLIFTGAQLAGMLLNGEIDDLRFGASSATLDISGLNTALNGLNTDTFVATIGAVFQNLATRIQGVISSISTERIAVRDAALNIVNPTVMSKEAINRGIAGINTSLPSNAAAVAKNAALTASDAALSAAMLAREKASTALPVAVQKRDEAAGYYQGKADELHAMAAKYGLSTSATGLNNDAYNYNAATNKLNPYNWISGNTNNIAAYAATFRAAAAPLVTILGGGNAALAAFAAGVTTAQTTLTTATTTLESAQANNTAAAAAAKKAALDYAAAIQNFAIDASKSVSKLTRLREETVKYYEAQKALADLMGNSAAGLRSTVADYRYSQMSDAQQYDKLQTDYATAYSLSLSTSGETLAGYADRMNALLGPLLEKAGQALAPTAYDTFAATAIARAEAIAGRLETQTPTNYAADSLSMLGSIDATLAALDASSRSAETIIADAVKAGSDRTADGLRAVIAALAGQPVPAFAAGGLHSGGIRLVGENGPELEVTGPSRIFNASQTREMLAGGGGSNAELVAEIRALRRDNENMRAELRAIATHTGKMRRLAERAEVDGALVRTDADTPLKVVTA